MCSLLDQYSQYVKKKKKTRGERKLTVLSLYFSLFSSNLAVSGALVNLTHISEIILERNVSTVLKTKCII